MAVPNPNESKLPAAQQAKMAELKALETAGQDAPKPEDTAAPVAKPEDKPEDKPTAPQDSTVVTFSRDEANDLRAKAERTAAADAKAEMAEMEIAELRKRLTAAEEGAKGKGESPAPAASEAAPGPVKVDPGDTTLTDDEREAYGESESTIVKIARRETAKMLSDVIAQLDKRIDARIKSVEDGVKQVSTSTTQTAARTFANEVKKNVPNFDEVINHKHWQDFLKSKVPVAGILYREALANAHADQSIEDMQGIFKTFTEKYIGKVATSGYGGIATTDDTGAPAKSDTKVMLKMSDRRKASEDFLKGRITAAQLDEIKAAFALAEKEGRIDYQN